MAEPEPRFTATEVFDMLEQAPARIAAATAGVSADDLLEPLESGGWSARDVLAHMRACHRTWGAYIDRILDTDHPAFRAESPRSTIRETDFLTLPFRALQDGFMAERAGLVDRLRAAGPDGLSRTATVKLPGRGAEERTAFYYAHRIAEHEREHVEHIERAMARSASSSVQVT